MKAISINFKRIQNNFPEHERGLVLARTVIEQVAGAEIGKLRPAIADDVEGSVKLVEAACPRWMNEAGEQLSAYTKWYPRLCAAAKCWLNPSLVRAWAFEIAEKPEEK